MTPSSFRKAGVFQQKGGGGTCVFRNVVCKFVFADRLAVTCVFSVCVCVFGRGCLIRCG